MILRWLDTTRLPVECDCLVPEALVGRSVREVARLVVRVGNADAELGELFAMDPAGDPVLTVQGDLRPVRGLGRGMERGTLRIEGDAGPHLGARMAGGLIEVRGDVDDHAGAEMRGGLLQIYGNAGDFLGASYPGSRLGMRDGLILVQGRVGDQAGRKMRRGIIAVHGSTGEAFGKGLIAGSLFAFGPIGRALGLGMKRGTIAALGPEPPEVLPSFVPSGRYRFPFLTLYLRALADWGFPVPADVFSATLGRYNGDLTEGGRGEILALHGPDEP